MRLFYTFLFVVFLVTTSFGQSFSLPDLIKMAKMDKDSFDTYVSSKKFVFLREINQDKIIGVTYGLNASSSGDGSAEKYITLYSKFYYYKYGSKYQSNISTSKMEYSELKSQIKSLGFNLINSQVYLDRDGISVNNFKYNKGKSVISLYNWTTGFEISYFVNY